MAYIPFAPENDAHYKLAFGTNVAAFNNKADADYVGMVEEISGLDSAEVRESFEDLVQADGGVHGDFYYGRRPIVISTRIYGHSTVAQRNARIDKIKRACNAMRGDATLTWPVAGTAISMFTTVRLQQPPRFQGGWVKSGQIALVSEYAQLFNAAQTLSGTLATGTDHVLENRGSGRAMPIIRINGNGGQNPKVENLTTGEIIQTNITLANGQWLEIDTLNHTAKRETGVSANGSINYLASSVIWPSLPMGNNTFRVTSAASMTLTYRDTWV